MTIKVEKTDIDEAISEKARFVGRRALLYAFLRQYPDTNELRAADVTVTNDQVIVWSHTIKKVYDHNCKVFVSNPQEVTLREVRK